MRISNLLFWVQENKVSEKFYKKLGFEILHSDDQYSIVKLGEFQITLLSMRDEEPFTKDSMTQEKGRGIYIYILVEDVDKKYEELLKNGFQTATSPRNWHWGNREFILKDPDGYKLCFWREIRERQ